ncbi:hypothetical protein [Streptomyces sp. NPDC127108]|uniref:hypothetical protein n=1 Tax=Streptomyces sp. NPDC127108 TaxID=3345361 RepID=UPI00363CA602
MSGLNRTTDVIAFTGDASWGGYTMVSGRWLDGPGEAVVPTPFLAAIGTRIGDTVTLDGLAEPVTVRIVGEVSTPATTVCRSSPRPRPSGPPIPTSRRPAITSRSRRAPM